MEIKRTKQCKKCPWKKSTDPLDIPNGYSLEKHVNLKGTIADQDNPLATINHTLRIMSCHDTDKSPCIGWLHNQLGPGNNIGLRLAVRNVDNIENIKTVGEQHNCFDDTLPTNMD